MVRLNPEKLHVRYLAETGFNDLLLPRRYTLTHSDVTGDLLLTIGSRYDKKQISRPYTRLMRDEVLAELINNKDNLEFRVYCHVSGGFVFGPARWRYKIFHSELPLVLEAIRNGDRTLFENNPELESTRVYVYFQSTDPEFNKVENWGQISDYFYRGK